MNKSNAFLTSWSTRSFYVWTTVLSVVCVITATISAIDGRAYWYLGVISGTTIILAWFALLFRPHRGEPPQQTATLFLAIMVISLAVGIIGSPWIQMILFVAYPLGFVLSRKFTDGLIWTWVLSAVVVVGSYLGTVIPQASSRIPIPVIIGYASIFGIFSSFMAFWIHSIQEWGNEREQMVQQLKNQQETLVEATKQRATQNERIRIAREVHDTLAQGFVAIIALSQSPGTRPQIEEIARENLAESRALMKSWRSPSLEKNDLPSAIHRLGKKHAARVSVKGDFSETSAEQQTAIFRAAQEALNNVSRHAEASDCSIALRADAGGYQLTIWDNGKGMSGELGNGLKGMVERAEALGGMVQIQSDYGTTLTFRIPKEQA